MIWKQSKWKDPKATGKEVAIYTDYNPSINMNMYILRVGHAELALTRHSLFILFSLLVNAIRESIKE